MSLMVRFRMNGVGNAFLRELGCRPCPQCDANKPRANTSGSVLVYDWTPPRGRLLYHVLFDCGLGVTDSLIDFGVSTASVLFISHGHADHCLDLDRLANSLRRSGGSVPLDVYCTNGAFAGGPGHHFPWLFQGALRQVVPGPSVPLGFGINLRVTQVPVWHGSVPKEPVIWVVEFGDKAEKTYRKLVLGWDLLHLVPRYPNDDVDPSYVGSTTSAAALEPAHQVLSDADELFIEANTYLPAPWTGHISVEGVMRSMIPLLNPKRTWLVHYSGHEDAFGPFSDAGLQRRVDGDKVGHGLINHPCGSQAMEWC